MLKNKKILRKYKFLTCSLASGITTFKDFDIELIILILSSISM